MARRPTSSGSPLRLVTAAVVQDASALQFASPGLKRSRSVVMAAATDGGNQDWARLFACPALAEDEDVALTAIGIDWHAAKHFSPRLKQDQTWSKEFKSLDIYGDFAPCLPGAHAPLTPFPMFFVSLGSGRIMGPSMMPAGQVA